LTDAFWRSFLRRLVERGLTGVQVVVSDAHAGLKKAIGQVLGCPWQGCSVHFLREALGHARREQQPMLAALLRPKWIGTVVAVIAWAAFVFVYRERLRRG
jgi:putative transposase